MINMLAQVPVDSFFVLNQLPFPFSDFPVGEEQSYLF